MRVRYDRLAKVVRPQVSWTLVHCWRHLRRRFVKLARNSKSPIAEAAVHQIAQLYAIEATVRGSSPEIRLAARRKARCARGVCSSGKESASKELPWLWRASWQ
ncbi:hypothetical protein ACVW1C_002280 [Bradyrhizobium sp. USDA 4011]